MGERVSLSEGKAAVKKTALVNITSKKLGQYLYDSTIGSLKI